MLEEDLPFADVRRGLTICKTNDVDGSGTGTHLADNPRCLGLPPGVNPPRNHGFPKLDFHRFAGKTLPFLSKKAGENRHGQPCPFLSNFAQKLDVDGSGTGTHLADTPCCLGVPPGVDPPPDQAVAAMQDNFSRTTHVKSTFLSGKS